jgi:AAHS family 4-hydroxybenzoate transporter-like MFS transporter
VAGSRTIDLADVMDEQPLRRLHVLVILLCGLAMFADGFDVQIMGYVAPSLIADWHLPRSALGPAFAAGLAGLMVGSMIWSPFSDRFGRKTTILIGLVLFSLCSLATAAVGTMSQLVVLRVLTGLGLGAVMPNAVAMTSEIAPARFRTTFVIVMWYGFTLGSGFGGGLVALLTRWYGWESAFIFGAILPLLAVPILAIWLPESPRSLVARRVEPAKIIAVLKRLDPSLQIDADAHFVVEDKKPTLLSGLSGLFVGRRAVVTLLLWAMFFANLLELYFLGSWMPTLMHDHGLSSDAAILATTMIHFGAIAGTLIIGALCDRYNVFTVMLAGFLFAGTCTASLGLVGESVALAVGIGFFAGFFITGGQVCANALAAQLYPTSCRATGIGWALGVGRFGSVVGPAVGGVLLAAGWSIPSVFVAAGLPCLIGAVSVFTLGRFVASESGRGSKVPVPV